MGWVRLDDQFPQHPKVVGVGPLGVALHVAALCYSSRYLTDGFIPAAAIPTLLDFSELDQSALNGAGPAYRPIVERLVQAGLWEETDGGYQIHDYLEYNPSQDEVLAKRQAAKERMARVRGMFARTSREHPENFARSSEEVHEMFADRSREVHFTPSPSRDPYTHPPPSSRETLQSLSRKEAPSRREGLPRDVTDLFCDLEVPDDASLAHEAIQTALEELGFACEREVIVPDRGDGVRGRIDLVARRGVVTMAIEIDYKSPRKKSIAKLRSFNATHRVLLLRGGSDAESIDGVAIVGLKAVPRASEEPDITRDSDQPEFSNGWYQRSNSDAAQQSKPSDRTARRAASRSPREPTTPRKADWDPPPWWEPLTHLPGYKHTAHKRAAEQIAAACLEAGVEPGEVVAGWCEYYRAARIANGWTDPVAALKGRPLAIQIRQVLDGRRRGRGASSRDQPGGPGRNEPVSGSDGVLVTLPDGTTQEVSPRWAAEVQEALDEGFRPVRVALPDGSAELRPPWWGYESKQAWLEDMAEVQGRSG